MANRPFTQPATGLPTDFAGRGPRNLPNLDDKIRDEVAVRLTDDPRIDASEIEFDVRDGEVRLSGVVSNLEQQRRAEAVVERIPGVRQILNSIRLPDARPVGRPSILERYRP